jgi:two-component system, cell cycle sensor histidine kinase and response regulator CckA
MKVLLVQPALPAQSRLHAALLGRGHELLVAGSPEEAWPAPHAQPFPLAVVDGGPLPGQAADRCRRLRRLPGGGDCHLLAVAPDAGASTLRALLEAGADDYLLEAADAEWLELRLTVAERQAAATAARWHSEQLCARQEQELRTIFDAVPAFIWYKDAENRILRANLPAAASMGLSVEEIQGRSTYELYPHEAASFHEADLQVIRSGEPLFGLIEPFTTPSGQRRWLQTDKIPHRGPDGRVRGVLVFSLDVTERKQAEEALRASEELNRRVLEAMPGGVVQTAMDGAILRANAEAQRILGLSFDRMSRRYVFDWEPETIWEDGSPCPASAYPVTRCLETGQPQPQATIGVRRPDGSISWAVFTAVPLRDPDTGSQAGAVATFLDVTERKQAAEALVEAHETLQTVVAAAPVPIYALDMDGKVQKVWNPAAERLLGWGAEEVLGRPLPTVSEDQREEYERLREWLRSGQSLVGREVLRRRKDGTPVECAVYAAPMRDRGGRISGKLVVLVDLAERKRAEQERLRLEAQIQHAQRLEGLGVLAGGIAHDFNNLLVGVLGNADLALLDLPPGEARQRIEDIKNAGLQAAALTRQMLAYSGQGHFVVEPIRLDALIAEMAHLLHVSISKKASLQYHFAEGLPWIEADVSQVRQIVMNLITNAAEALGGESGTITLSTRPVEADAARLGRMVLNESLRPGHYVELEVTDTGSGMSEETKAKIFDPFFTTKFTGRGLGLSAVLGIVRGHRGGVQVLSAPGQGTTFRVLFPASQRPAQALPGGEGQQRLPLSGSGLVLVIDDEPAMRQVASIMLQSAGFEALTAVDGQEGVELFRQNASRLAAVVLDMTMPRMGGEEAFARFREIRPEVPVLLTSGYTEQVATEHFAGLGLAGFLHKPFQRVELLTRVLEAIEAARLSP